MERVTFNHIWSDEAIDKLDHTSAEYEHWKRYKWVAKKLRNKKVLDIACGTGYGSALLSLHNKVMGVDISEEAIKEAKENFEIPNFKVGNAEKLEFDNESFDAVVSFETIEHLDKPQEFIKEVRRVLKKDGMFYGSIPKESDTQESREHNKFHKNFYGSINDIFQVLSSFKDITITSQLNDMIGGYKEELTKYFIFEAKKSEIVSIIIPTYNSQEVFEACHFNLLQAGYPYETIVIDNASKDKRYLNKHGVTYVFNDKNYKFTHAVNQGIELAKGEYVLLLNPDCIGNLQKGWLRQMLIDLGENGIAGAILKFPDGKIQHAGAEGFGKHIGLGEEDKGQYDIPRTVEWVTGACMLFRKDLVKEVGLWDTKFPHYESDREWCKKVKEKGYKIVCSRAKLTHLEGKSSVEPVRKGEKLRILWHSNSAWTPTGYGNQTALITQGIHKAGFPIAISSYYGLEGGILNMGGILCYPKIASTWGEDSMVSHGQDFKADIVITLMDIWPLNTALFKDKIKWISYTPVDHDEVPPPVLVRARDAYRVIAYSKHGQEAFKRKGIDAHYIPHCIDTKIFYPRDKKESRKIFNIPEDSYCVGMVAQNKSLPSRKAFQQALEAFSLFAKNKPRARLYLHTIMGTEQGGMNLIEYCMKLGIMDKIIHTSPYMYLYKLTPEDLAKLYSSFDVLLAVAMGEGFGIPIIESQSCGIPVITSSWTSMKELCGSGLMVESSEKWWTPLAAYQFHPKMESILEALEKLYNSDAKIYKKKAVDFAKSYDVDIVMRDYWVPYLNSL